MRVERVLQNIFEVWEEVLTMRGEYEIRIARLELLLKGKTKPSLEDLNETRSIECGPYEDVWMDLQAKIDALETHGTNKSGATNSLMYPDDSLDLDWLRSSVTKNLEKLRNGTKLEEKVDRDLLIENVRTSMAKAKRLSQRLSQKMRPNLETPALEPEPPAALEVEEDKTKVRTLKVSLQGMKVDVEKEGSIYCVIEVNGYKRAFIGASTGRRSGIGNLPSWFQNFTNDSLVQVFLFSQSDFGSECIGKSEISNVRNLVSMKDNVVDIGDGEVVLRFTVTQEELVEEEAKRFHFGAQETENRGGAHVTIPRFVKKLKALKQMKDNHYRVAELHPGDCKSVEDECVKPLPDLKWIEQEILNGWNGEIVFNARGQNALHLMVGNSGYFSSLTL